MNLEFPYIPAGGRLQSTGIETSATRSIASSRGTTTVDDPTSTVRLKWGACPSLFDRSDNIFRRISGFSDVFQAKADRRAHTVRQKSPISVPYAGSASSSQMASSRNWIVAPQPKEATDGRHEPRGNRTARSRGLPQIRDRIIVRIAHEERLCPHRKRELCGHGGINYFRHRKVSSVARERTGRFRLLGTTTNSAGIGLWPLNPKKRRMADMSNHHTTIGRPHRAEARAIEIIITIPTLKFERLCRAVLRMIEPPYSHIAAWRQGCRDGRRLHREASERWKFIDL